MAPEETISLTQAPHDRGERQSMVSEEGAASQEGVLDRWLKEFDVKQATLSARQDAFLLRLGIQVGFAAVQTDSGAIETVALEYHVSG